MRRLGGRQMFDVVYKEQRSQIEAEQARSKSRKSVKKKKKNE